MVSTVDSKEVANIGLERSAVVPAIAGQSATEPR